MNLSNGEILLLARLVQNRDSGYLLKITSVERRSDREYDLTVSGQACYVDHQVANDFSGWLPLSAIKHLTNWSSPAIAEKCDHPIEAGWSAIRDSSEGTVWAIFSKFVLGVV